MLQAILWDVDGTLVSTKDLYLECYRRALAPYVGRLLSDEELLALRPHSELHVLKSQAGAAFEECIAAFREHYRTLHPTFFGGVYPGIAETLAALRQTGLRNGIITGKSRSSWEVTSAETALGDFDVVIVDDDVANPKPDPEGILAALDALGVHAQHAVYIGDSPADMEAALAAGTHAAAAMWSKSESWRQRFLQRTAGLQNIVLLDQPYDLLHHFRISTTSLEGARSSSVR